MTPLKKNWACDVISEEEIVTALVKLKGGRAAGLDEILATTRSAVPWLCRSSNPDNYRGICLTSIFVRFLHQLSLPDYRAGLRITTLL